MHESYICPNVPFKYYICVAHYRNTLLTIATILCPLLDEPNGGSIFYSVDISVKAIGFGVTAISSCNHEFEGLSKGDQVRTCGPDGNSGGKWSGVAPSCESM